MPAPSRYAVAADVVVIAETPEPSVLLIRRRNPPLGWAIPGGFVEPDEDLIDAARRELHEETGLEPPRLEQLATFGHPDRDPRGRTISVVYGARLHHAALPAAGDDAAAARWFPLTALPTSLAFDHATILAHVLARLVD
ncbi:MAG: NUDIX hydrolase [Chloroflexota bacterium]|nr:NUDIX hydrolase [Chloroflexota bacterium]MDE2918705.1 NUDIX hydrolase [Chloroflexota bacterium]